MVRIVCVGLAFIFTSLSPALAFEQADKQVGVVQVVNITRSSTGSGFVLNDEGYIATNHHVVNGGVRLYVNPDGETIDFRTLVRNPNAKVVWASSDLDLAIVKVNNPKDFHPITLAEVLPRKGETVYAVGYPGAADDYNIKGSRDLTSDASVTKGVLSRSYVGSWGRTPLELVQHNAEISWGNSGGPLFDECRRVIGINTKLTSKKFGRNVVVAPGAFFSSNVSELMKVLKNKSIAYGSTSERCRSREDQLQEMVRNSIVIGIAAVVILAGLIIVALRKPRERVVQLVERYSRSIRSHSPGNPAAPRRASPQARPAVAEGSLPRFGLTLEGQDAAGSSYKIQIDKGDLVSGVTIGREPPDARFAVRNDEVSRQHASLYAKDGLLYVRDEESTNGTFLNGRSVRPRYSEIAGNGDELRFGSVTLRINFV